MSQSENCVNCGRLPDLMTGICLFCEVQRFRGYIGNLLVHVGDQGICKGCGAKIYWLRHKNGKAVPYSVTGQNHFADCPERAQFRKKS